MNDITMDADLQRRIGAIDGEKALVDEQGNIRGYIVTPMMRAVIADWINSKIPPVPANWRTDNTKAYTTAEAIAAVKEMENRLRRAG